MYRRHALVLALLGAAGCATSAELMTGRPDAGYGSTGGTDAGSGATPGSGGVAGTGNAAGTGGVATDSGQGGDSTAGGTTSAGGSSGGSCGVGPDTDADGVDDCTEQSDGDPWTDSAVFNGVVARLHGGDCGSTSCSVLDTTAEVDACLGSVLETQNLSAGWDHGSDGCDAVNCAAYGYSASWSSNSDDFTIAADAFVNLTAAGKHCFQMYGDADGAGCAALFVNGATTGLTSSTSASSLACYDLAAGVYPIRWVESELGAASNEQRVRYCFAGTATSCTPTAAIPASMLRVSP